MNKSLYCSSPSPVYVSDYMSGKMTGIPQIGTSCKLNPLCARYAKDPRKICAYCFAEKTISRYGKLAENLAYNTNLLVSNILDFEDLPVFNSKATIIRFEAFGDLQNAVQCINYLNIAYKNPYKAFALWTKNPLFVRQACDEYGKPANLQILQSSPFLNRKCEKSNQYIDKTFTVYDKATVERDHIDINCGARNCLGCQRCYHANGEDDIRELVK